MPPSRTATRRVTNLQGVDWYDLPAWYDILHARGTAADVDGIERVARRHLPGRRGSLHLLEPACGTARHLRRAVKRGHRVVGVDLSRPMLEYAEAALRRDRDADGRGRLVEADIEHLDRRTLGLAADETGPDVAFCLVNSLRHLPSDAALARHLRSTLDLLRPGGVYVVGLGLTDYGGEQPSEDVWHGARGPCRVTQVVQYLPAPGGRGPEARRERVVSSLAVVTPTAETFVDHRYDLRAYDARQWSAVLNRAGAEVVATVDEAGNDFDWPWREGSMGYGLFVLRSSAAARR